MYFWRIENLKSTMALAPLTEREALPYLIAFVALTSIAPIFSNESKNVWDYTGIAWSLIVAVLGTIYAYQRNGGESGCHFLQRYLAIGWVISVRWGILIFVIFGIFFWIADFPEKPPWYCYVVFACAEIVLWKRVAHHIGDLASRSSQSNSALNS